MASRVEIELTATGAAAVSKVFDDVAQKSRKFAEDLSSGSKRIESSFGSTRGALNELSSVMGQAGVNTGILGQALGALSSPMGIAAAGAVALGLALKQTVDYMKQNYEQLKQLQAVSGLAAEEADQLADAWELLGGNAQALTTSLFKMSAEIESGGKGLRDLGINIRDMTGALKEPGEVFLELRDRISEIGNASQRNALLLQYFGRAGRENADIFSLSTEEFNKWLVAAGKIGPSAEDSMRVTKDYARAQAELNKNLQGFTESIGIKMLPILTDITRGLLAAMKATTEWGNATTLWLNTLSDRWEKYKATALWGPGTAFPNPIPPPAEPPAGAPPGGAGGSGLGPRAAAEIKVVTDELKKMRDQLEVMRASQLDQPIVKLEQAFREFAATAGPAATKEMRALTNEAIALTRALQDVPNQLAAMKALADQGLGDLKTADMLLELKDIDDELKTFSVRLGESRDQVKIEAEEMRALAEAELLVAEALKQIGPLAEALGASSGFGDDKFTQTLIDANRELRALKAASDLDAESIRTFGVSFKLLDEDTQAALLSLRSWRTEAEQITVGDKLAAIGREAALIGPNFDEAAAKLDVFKQRILELQAIKNPTGDMLAELDQLKAKFADTRDFIQWRTMFEGVFASVGDAINTLVQGVILGTQTMAEAFKKLGQAIITQFVNAVIQQALNPLVKAAAGVVAGIFSATPRTAGAAGTGSSGDIDIGGPSLSVPSIPTGIFDTGTLSNLWSGFTNGWAAFNEGLDAGASTFEALSSSWDTFTTAFGGAASGLSVGLAGVGAAVAAFGTIMDLVNGKTAAGVGGIAGAAVGGVAGGLVGTYVFPGVGTALGALVGAALGDTLGSWLGGMFGGPSNYELKRIQAADDANEALGNLTRGFEAALKTFNASAVLGSLQTGAGGVGNSVRTELVLPSGLAQQIGLTGQQIGDQLVTQWSALTLEQFDKVIAAFRDQPDLIQNIRGSGDVPLLAGGDAEAVAQQIAQGAQALLTAFGAMLEVRDRIRTLAVDLTTAANEVLPLGAADAFAGRVNEFRDRMLAVLSSGLPVAEMQKQMDALEAELRNYTGLVDLYSQNTQLIAKLSADFVAQTRGAVLAIRTSLTAADRAVSNAQAAANRAMTPEAELKATTALRDAIVNRYQMEVEMVNKLAASLADIATKQGAVQQTLTTSAIVELDRGDATAFNEIYLALADMAMVAPTTAQRLWAVGQGLAAVLAALPTTAKNLSGADIGTQIQSQVAPFFSALGDMIRGAAAAGDLQGQLALLEQEADLVKQVGSALVQAVNEWAAAASDAVRTVAGDAADDVNKNWDAFADASHAAAEAMRDDVTRNWDAFAEASHAAADAAKADITKNWDALRDGVTAAADAAIQGEQDKIDAIELATKIRQKQIDLEIKGIEDATKAQQQAIAAQIDALQEQTAAAKEWEGAAKSIHDFVLGLKLSNQAPSNPADQLALAQAEFAKAQAAFAATPTAAGAGEAQKAAQAVLDAAGNVLTRTSPEYQKLFASVVDAMEGIGGAAGAMAPVSSADLEQQTEILRAQSQAIGEDAATRIDALREESVKLNEKAAEQIAVIREGIANIRTLLDAELKRIDQARRHDLDLVDAWLKVRDEEIKQGRAHDLGVIDAWIKARDAEIKAGRAYNLGVVKGWLDAQLAQIEASRKGTVEGVQDGMIAALRANATEQNRILGLLEGAQRAALDEITKGVPLEQFKAKAAADTVSQLVKLNGQIEQFLLGSGHAKGLAYVPATGPYKLHQGERVLNEQERIAYEGGMASAQKRGGGPSITYAPTVNVSGAGDPALIKAMVEEALRRDRRDFLRELETGAAGARLRT